MEGRDLRKIADDAVDKISISPKIQNCIEYIYKALIEFAQQGMYNRKFDMYELNLTGVEENYIMNYFSKKGFRVDYFDVLKNKIIISF